MNHGNGETGPQIILRARRESAHASQAIRKEQWQEKAEEGKGMEGEISHINFARIWAREAF